MPKREGEPRGRKAKEPASTHRQVELRSRNLLAFLPARWISLELRAPGSLTKFKCGLCYDLSFLFFWYLVRKKNIHFWLSVLMKQKNSEETDFGSKFYAKVQWKLIYFYLISHPWPLTFGISTLTWPLTF